MDQLWLFVEFVELSGTFLTSVCSLCNTSIFYTSIFEFNVILSNLMYVSVLMAAFCTFTDISNVSCMPMDM